MVSASGGEQEADGVAPPSPLPPKRRSRLRLFLRLVVLSALVCLVLAALGIGLLHTPPGRTALRGFIESWGSTATGGTLRLGQLDLALWKGHAAATAVSLALPGARIEVQGLAVEWSPASGPHLTLVRPHIVVTDSGVPGVPRPRADGLAAQPWRVLERLERADVVDGRLELRDATGAPWLVLGRVDFEMAGASRRTSLRIADAAIGWPEGGLRVRPAEAEATLSLDGGVLVVEQARITASASSLELAGRVRRVLPLSAAATARAAMDGALVEAVAPGSGLQGRIEADATVDVADDRVTGRLDAAAPALKVAGVGPWSATGSGRLEGASLVVESFTARGFGGRLDAQGPLALVASASTDLRLRAEDLDPAALARAVARVDLPLSTRASGSLRVTTQGWDLEGARGEGRIALSAGAGSGLKPTGSATLRTRGLALTLAGAHVEARGASVAADAELTASGNVTGRWSVDLPIQSLTALLADLGQPARAPELEGRLLAEGDVAGPVRAPLVSARVRGQDLALRRRPLGLEAELRYESRRLSVAPLVLRSGSGQATLTGGIPLAADGEWDLTGEVDALELDPALALVGLEGSGPATGTVRVTGRRGEPVARASLRATAHLRRPEAASAADDVVLELETASTGRHVRIERLEAELAGGRLSGTGDYDPTSDALEVTLEATGLDWQKLPLVPATARRISGALAGRLAVSGSTTHPVGDLQLTLSDVALDGSPLPALSLMARSDGRELSLTGSGPDEVVKGSARLEGDWPLRLEVDAKALPLQPLLDALKLAPDAHATLAASGTIAVELPLREPSRLRYSSSDLAVSGRIRRLDWRVAPFSLRGDRASLELQGLRLDAGKAWLAANGRVALASASPFDLDLEGHLDVEALGLALAARTLGGTGDLKLQVRGTREFPALAGSLGLADVRGRFEGARWSGLNLTATFAGRELRVERLEANLLGGKLSASGALPLVAGGGGEAKHLAFELRDVDLARLLDRELREAADSPSLLLSLDGELRAEALSLPGLSGSGRLTSFDTRSVEGTLSALGACGLVARARCARRRAGEARRSARRSRGPPQQPGRQRLRLRAKPRSPAGSTCAC